jgi:hypothetical protein
MTQAYNTVMPAHYHLDIIKQVRAAPSVVTVEPGRRHWPLLPRMCRQVDAEGNAVPDAYLAALSTEHGAERHTADRGFARYAGLRVRHPLDPEPLVGAARGPDRVVTCSPSGCSPPAGGCGCGQTGRAQARVFPGVELVGGAGGRARRGGGGLGYHIVAAQ